VARGGRGGDGDSDPPSGGRPGRPQGGGSESISAAQETVAAEANLGRPGGGAGGRGAPSGDGSGRPAGGRPDGQPDDLVTHPTGEPGGTPDGQPTRIRPHEDEDVRRSLERENSGAAILADRGHQVTQNPSPEEVAQARQDAGDSGRPTSRPDYLVEGRVFDCYAPSQNKGVRGIWTEVAAKVSDDQTQRVVVNLQDWRGNVPDLQRQFNDWPIEKLKEVKVITPDGDVVQITPKPENG
jgi:hypothetical protein